MFFLEVGEPLPRAADRKTHGEWHFLLENCHWRIGNESTLLVGSDDAPELIDKVFSSGELGTITSARAHLTAHDLEVVFSSGLLLTTFGASLAAKNEWTQWQLYGPDDDVWVVNASGELSRVHAHA